MNGDGPEGKRSEASSAPADLSRRLERLGADLEAKRPAAPPRGPESPASPSGPSALGQAFRASSEFMAGVIVGGGIGWAFDKGLGSSPWGLIVFLMLGFAAGIFNVMRSSGFLATSSQSGGPPATRRDH